MNDKQLSNFVTIVDEGSISNASKVLYVSPSALSQLIKKMEEEVGAELFIRGKHSLQLSYAGRQMYNYALNVSRSYKQLLSTFKDMDGISTGDFILSLSVKRAISLLPIILPPFMKKYPHVTLKTIADMYTVKEREENLLTGKADLIINTYHSKRTNPEIEYVKIGNERVILFAGKETELAKRLVTNGQVPDSVPLEEIADESFLLSSPVYGGRFMIDRMFDKIGKVPKILAQISPVCVSKSIVETGHFCTLSAELFKNGKPITPPADNYYTIPIRLTENLSQVGSRPVYIGYKKNMNLVSFQRDFIQMTINMLYDDTDSGEG